MTGKKMSKEKVTPTPPDAKSNREKEKTKPETAVEPDTGQAEMAPDPRAVAAGPGNQLQENDTQLANQNNRQNDLKPGAQPDGTLSINEDKPRNEGIE